MQLISQVVDNEYLHRPDVFRRDALVLSFQMLRRSHADLALLLQNLLQGIPLQADSSHPEAEALQVRLSRSQVREIRTALTGIAGSMFTPAGNTAPDFAHQWIITWALINDWQALEESDCCV